MSMSRRLYGTILRESYVNVLSYIIILSRRVASHRIAFYLILFNFYSILFYSIPFHSIPFHSIPFHSIPLHSMVMDYVPYINWINSQLFIFRDLQRFLAHQSELLYFSITPQLIQSTDSTFFLSVFGCVLRNIQKDKNFP